MSHIEQFAELLVSRGVRYAFGVTGGGPSIRLIAALQRNGVVYYPVSHEAAAAIMAGACSRDGAVRAVAISIKGPGFANMAPGILSNYYERRPSVSVSEAYSPQTPKHVTHKMLDHSIFCAEITKAHAYVGDDSLVHHNVLDIAESEPPGPVHFNVFQSPVSYYDIVSTNDTVVSVHDELNELIEIIKGSERPVLVLGGIFTRVKVNFNHLKLPVLTTAAGKGVFDETSIFAAGIITGEISMLSPEVNILNSADLVIGIGLRNYELVRSVNIHKNLVLIDNGPTRFVEGLEPFRFISSISIEATCQVVIDSLMNKCWGENIVRDYKDRILQKTRVNEWLPAGVFRTLQTLLPPETTLVLDTGFFCTVGESIWKTKDPMYFCGSSIGRFMGVGIPTAIGVAISDRDLECILCVVGDGGITPYICEMRIATNECLPIIFVLFSDGRFGSVASQVELTTESKRAIEVVDGNLAACVEGLGIRSVSASNFDSLRLCLQSWKKSQGPLFIQCSFDPTAYAESARGLR